MTARLLRWASLDKRVRAATAAALAALLDRVLFGTRHVAVCFGGGVRLLERVPPGQAVCGHVAGVLDGAYCVLSPHEAARRAELHRTFRAMVATKNRTRAFVARRPGRLG